MKSQLKPFWLTCEYLQNPKTIQSVQPVFSWVLPIGSGGSSIQTAFQILVYVNDNNPAVELDVVWDTGKVCSSQSIAIPYTGRELKSSSRYYWKVKFWDEQDRSSAFSDLALFETSLLAHSEWKAEWIGFLGWDGGTALLFRRECILRGNPLKATAYVSGLGFHNFYVNGERIGDMVLEPALTVYDKRVLYTVYDVTQFITKGKNTIGAECGKGWYGSPALRIQLQVTYVNGSNELFTSHGHEDWIVSRSPITANSVYDGEIYNGRHEKQRWASCDYNVESDNSAGEGWLPAMYLTGPPGRMVAQQFEPIRRQSLRNYSTKRKLSERVAVFDFSFNGTGWVKLRASGKAGDTVTIKYGELLDARGMINQDNLRTARSRDVYIFRGGKNGARNTEEYEPRFTYHGFRYVQIEAPRYTINSLDIHAVTVRTDVSPSGVFKCGNALFNRIHEMCVSTEESNLFGLPIDCPQRDERVGWLNDVSVRAEESMYNFNVYNFYRKWLLDIRDSQDPATGAIPDTAPRIWGRIPADPVAVCYVQLPWQLYIFYGNKLILDEFYEGCKAWVNFLETMSDAGIIYYSYYGDWASPVAVSKSGTEGDDAVSEITPGDLVSTCAFFQQIEIMKKMAKVLAKQEDVAYFSNLETVVKQQFHKRFFDSRNNWYGTGSQAAQAYPLYLKMVPNEAKDAVLQNLVGNIQENHYHPTTGNQCTKYMLDALSMEGETETAYQLLNQTTYPSWGYMLAMGATTVWERWEYKENRQMNSHNHPMFGSIDAWFF